MCQSPSRVQLCATPWTVSRQASLSIGFSRQEYWTGVGSHTFLQGIFPTQGLNLHLLLGRFFTTETPGKSIYQGLVALLLGCV